MEAAPPNTPTSHSGRSGAGTGACCAAAGAIIASMARQAGKEVDSKVEDERRGVGMVRAGRMTMPAHYHA
ncbi:hypothetical protein GCM10007387_09950 [Pseudoduganella albidiflava]|uniref:Uncharacterized protein n=1 Tax=Pseudoduganella albidiflava TaxID=321983 RepID=A0AA87XPG9_9BURK|nr:hypothetical protein GCM10007387_09950 [Pseudoduganella albidiflava]